MKEMADSFNTDNDTASSVVPKISTSASLDDGSLDGRSQNGSMDLAESGSQDSVSDNTHASVGSQSSMAHRRTAKARAGRNKKKDRVLWSATRKRAADGSFMKSNPSELDAIRKHVEQHKAKNIHTGQFRSGRVQGPLNPRDGLPGNESDGDSNAFRKRGRPRKKAPYTASLNALEYYEGTGVGKRRVQRRVDPDFSYASMEYGRRAYKDGLGPHGAYSRPPLPHGHPCSRPGIGLNAMTHHIDQLNNLVNEAKDNHDDSYSDCDAANTILQFQQASGVDSQNLNLQFEEPVEKRCRGRPRKPEGSKPGYALAPQDKSRPNDYSQYATYPVGVEATADATATADASSSVSVGGMLVGNVGNSAPVSIDSDQPGNTANSDAITTTATTATSEERSHIAAAGRHAIGENQKAATQRRDVLARSKDMLSDKNIIVDKHGRMRERGTRGQFVKSEVSNYSINLHNGIINLNAQGKQRHGGAFNHDEDRLFEEIRSMGVDTAALPEVVTLEERIKQEGLGAIEADRKREEENQVWSPDVLMTAMPAPVEVEETDSGANKRRSKKKKRVDSKSTGSSTGSDPTLSVDLFFSKAFDIIESELLIVLGSLAIKQQERAAGMPTNNAERQVSCFPHLPGISSLVSSLTATTEQDKQELLEVVRMKTYLDGIFFYYNGNISDLLTQKYYSHKGDGAQAFTALKKELSGDKKALMRYIVVWSKEEQVQVQEMYQSYLNNQHVIHGVERGDLGTLLTHICHHVHSKSREQVLEYIIRFIQGAEALDNVLADEAVMMKKAKETGNQQSLRQQVMMVETTADCEGADPGRSAPLSPGATAKSEAANILCDFSGQPQPNLAVEVDTSEGGSMEMVIKDTTLGKGDQEIYRGDVHLTQQNPSDKEAVLESLLTDYLSFYYRLAYQELDNLTFLMLCNSLSLMFQRLISTTELAMRVRVILGYNTLSSHNRILTTGNSASGPGFVPVAMPHYTNSTLLRKSSTVRQALLDVERQGRSVGGEGSKLVPVFAAPTLSTRTVSTNSIIATNSNDTSSSTTTGRTDQEEGNAGDADGEMDGEKETSKNAVNKPASESLASGEARTVVDEIAIPLPQKSIGLTEYYPSSSPIEGGGALEGTQQHLTTYSNFLHHLCSPHVANVILRHSNVVPVMRDTESWALLSRLWREIPECGVKGMWITRGKVGAEKPLYKSGIAKIGQ